MEEKEKHFNKIFWFICAMSGIIMGYIFSATFIRIPDNVVHFVDTNMGYFQNALSSMIGYYVGASAVSQSKKQPDSTNGDESIIKNA